MSMVPNMFPLVESTMFAFKKYMQYLHGSIYSLLFDGVMFREILC